MEFETKTHGSILGIIHFLPKFVPCASAKLCIMNILLIETGVDVIRADNEITVRTLSLQEHVVAARVGAELMHGSLELTIRSLQILFMYHPDPHENVMESSVKM